MSRAKTVKYALPLIALVGITACASTGQAEQTSAEEQSYQNAIEQALAPATPEQIAQAERSDPITRANFWSNEYQKDSSNLETSLSFIRALRQINSHERVLEIASVTIPIHPESYELYLELGRSFLADDKPTEAAQAFVRSADLSPETDAAPLAGLGLAFDRLENHEQAQEAYEIALHREPNRISTLSNYGLSLALTGKLDQAEAALRKASEQPGADVRVRQNLALVLGLQGKYDEMAAVDPGAPRRTVDANEKVLRDMMLPSRDYSELQSLDAVMAEASRGPIQEMPGVPQANVASEAMAEPVVEAAQAPAEADLAGGDAAAPRTLQLRPKLRGSQGG